MGLILGVFGLVFFIGIIAIIVVLAHGKKSERLEEEIKNIEDEKEKQELQRKLDKSNAIINYLVSDDLTKAEPEKSKKNNDEFNTKGAIIGGALGGITGAYIGSHVKKEDDK